MDPLHHEESGSGTPIVFLHGNPGSSHFWRNVLPVSAAAACWRPTSSAWAAPASPTSPTPSPTTPATSTPGSTRSASTTPSSSATTGAARSPSTEPPGTRAASAGMAFFETIVKPMVGDDFSPQAAGAVRARSARPGVGEEMVLEQNLFVRQAFTGGVRTPVADLEPYLAPFPTPESRRPILAWARQLARRRAGRADPPHRGLGEWLKPAPARRSCS